MKSQVAGIKRVDALSFECPKCGAAIGHYCITTKNTISKIPHAKRVALLKGQYVFNNIRAPMPVSAMSSFDIKMLRVGDKVYVDGDERTVRSVGKVWVFLVGDTRPINVDQARLCGATKNIPVFKTREDFLKSRSETIKYACLSNALSKLKSNSFDMTAGLRDELIQVLEKHNVKVY